MLVSPWAHHTARVPGEWKQVTCKGSGISTLTTSREADPSLEGDRRLPVCHLQDKGCKGMHRLPGPTQGSLWLCLRKGGKKREEAGTGDRGACAHLEDGKVASFVV